MPHENVDITEDDLNKLDTEITLLTTYLAGYCVNSVLKRLNKNSSYCTLLNKLYCTLLNKA